MHFDPLYSNKISKRLIALQQLCNKFKGIFVPLAKRSFKANEAIFKSTDNVNDYIIIDTGALDGIGNTTDNYDAHKDIQNGPLINLLMEVVSKSHQLISFQ